MRVNNPTDYGRILNECVSEMGLKFTSKNEFDKPLETVYELFKQRTGKLIIRWKWKNYIVIEEYSRVENKMVNVKYKLKY